MRTFPNLYRGFCYPAEVIEHAVWLYHCFSLSLRDIGTILAARGVVVSYTPPPSAVSCLTSSTDKAST